MSVLTEQIKSLTNTALQVIETCKLSDHSKVVVQRKDFMFQTQLKLLHLLLELLHLMFQFHYFNIYVQKNLTLPKITFYLV